MEFDIDYPHVQHMRISGLIYRAIDHPFLATKIFFVAKIPTTVAILRPSFAPRIRHCCSGSDFASPRQPRAGPLKAQC